MTLVTFGARSMKSQIRTRIIPRWEPDERFALPLQCHAPIARRAAEFVPEKFYAPEDAWESPTHPLWM